MSALLQLASAALVAACLAAPQASPAQLVARPLAEGRLSVELESFGGSREEALASARREAVDAAVVRATADGRLILAEQLLVRYLDNFADSFVDSVEVLSDQHLRGGRLVSGRVFVNTARLMKDLEEKRFLYTPAFRPLFAVTMSETLDGARSSGGIVRDAMTFALDEVGLRPFEGALASPSPTVDLLADEAALAAAMESAQRAGVELLVTGESTTTLLDRRKLYFNEYYFVDTTIIASLVRADTGETIATVRATGGASDPNEGTALNKAARQAASAASKQLMAAYEDYWPAVMQGAADFTLLLSGADAAATQIVASRLRALSPNARAEVRRAFGKSAVLAVTYGGDKDDVFGALDSLPYPRITVLNPDDEKHFELQVVSR